MAQLQALHQICCVNQNLSNTSQWRCTVQVLLCFRSVAMYLSYSPCANCADSIIDFSTSRPQCQLSVRFSCIYRHKKYRHRDGLRRLNAAPRVVVGVFTSTLFHVWHIYICQCLSACGPRTFREGWRVVFWVACGLFQWVCKIHVL